MMKLKYQINLKNKQIRRIKSLKIHKNKSIKVNRSKILKMTRNQSNKRNQRYGTTYHQTQMIKDLPVKMNNRLKLNTANKNLKNRKKRYFLINN